MILKVLGINDFSALIIHICHCQHCSTHSSTITVVLELFTLWQE